MKGKARDTIWVKGLKLLLVLLLLFVVSQAPQMGGIQVAGFRSLVVLSGSMAPEITPGSLIVVQRWPVDQLEVGDIVTFRQQQEVVTHRVTKVITEPLSFQTKGDANQRDDYGSILADEVIGKYRFSLPLIGEWLLRLRTVPGLVAVAGVVLFFKVLSQLKARKE